jgi:hypothetical protein
VIEMMALEETIRRDQSQAKEEIEKWKEKEKSIEWYNRIWRKGPATIIV